MAAAQPRALRKGVGDTQYEAYFTLTLLSASSSAAEASKAVQEVTALAIVHRQVGPGAGQTTGSSWCVQTHTPSGAQVGIFEAML